MTLLFTMQLLLAHLIGDFVLQPDHWVRDKAIRRLKSPYLYWHIVVHCVVLIVLLQFNLTYWLGILAIILSHYLIDATKLIVTTSKNHRLLFCIDQLAHLAVIAAIIYVYHPYQLPIIQLFSLPVLLSCTFVLLTTAVSSVMMKVFISRWNLDSLHTGETLEQAGKYIGMIERFLIFIFIIMQHWEGVGFLIAAKSVFRFSDLTNAKDRKLTEYILIGTLLSFTLAIIFGLLYVYLSTFIDS